MEGRESEPQSWRILSREWCDLTGSLWLLLRMDFGVGGQKEGDHLGGLHDIQGQTAVCGGRW